MPNIVAAIAIIGPHLEQVGGKRRTVPIATGLVECVRPRIAQNIRHAMPWPLRQGGLQSVIVAEILVRDVIDIRQIRELAEIRSSEILAGGATGSSRTGDL